MALRPIVRALVVPVLGLSLSGLASHPAVAEGEAPASHKVVNINQATSAELTRLPRVGAEARRPDRRAPHGARSVQAHRGPHGGQGRRARSSSPTLKPYLTVSGPTTLAEKVSSKGSRGASSKTKKSGASATKKAKA